MFHISKNTFTVDKINPIPNDIMNKVTKGYIISKFIALNLTPVTIITKNKGIKDITNIINVDITLDKGYMYFGTYIFFIKELLPVIDLIDWFVDCEKIV